MIDKNNKHYIWDKIFRAKTWGKYPSEDLIRFISKNYYNSKVNRENIKILEIDLEQEQTQVFSTKALQYLGLIFQKSYRNF